MTSTQFMELLNTYKTKGHNILNIKLSDNKIYTVIIKEFYYWRYSAFYMQLTPKRIRMGESRYEILPQEPKFLFPAKNFSVQATKEQLIARNPRDIHIKDIFVEVLKYFQKQKEPVYGKMTPTNIIPQDNFILFDYDENQLSIKLSTTSRLNSNEFVYVMEIKNAESIIFNVNIAEFSKEFEFSSIEGLIDTSVYFGKRKMNTNVYTITPLYTIEEYEDFCSDIELTSRLNPEEDFFKDYFIVVVPITHSSSTIENKYVNCFTKDGHLFFNFTMLEEKNASFDYYEDLIFIKISNNYQNYDFEKIVVNI